MNCTRSLGVNADWTKLCRRSDFTVEGEAIVVRFAGERKHRVTVREEPTTFLLTARVANASAVGEHTDVALRLWRMNRGTRLVGYRLDERGRILGQARVPKAGLTADEFQLYVHTVAADCDRLEQVLTGSELE